MIVLPTSVLVAEVGVREFPSTLTVNADLSGIEVESSVSSNTTHTTGSPEMSAETCAKSSVGATLSSTLTDVPSTSAMPLPGTSVTASAARSTVTFVSVVRSAVSNVTTTFVASVESIATLSMLWSVVPFFTVIPVLPIVPMASLKVRMIFVRSFGSAAARDSVGLMPLILWLESGGTAKCVGTARCPSGPMYPEIG